MSKSPTRSPRSDEPETPDPPAPPELPEPIKQFIELVPVLIGAASEYAAATEVDPAAEGNIRRIKVLTASLMGALNAIRPSQTIGG